MTPVLTAAEMSNADRRAIDECGIPGPVLMENAARGCYEVIHELLGGDVVGRSILVLCGGGNNGGDGVAIARHAAIHGMESLCLVLTGPENVGEETAAQLRIAESFPEIEIAFGTEFLDELSGDDFDLIVDAMLGTGATGAPRSPFAEAIAWANDQYRPTVAVDIPSGLHPDTGVVEGEVFLADATVTMAAIKPGLLLNSGPEVTGELFVAHIGSPAFLYNDSSCRLIDTDDAIDGLPNVEHSRHKYDRGKLLVLAGSGTMGGAGTLVSHAAISAGAGLVVYGMPASISDRTVPRLYPEIMSRELPDSDGGFASTAYEAIADELDNFSLIALGPGLGRTAGAQTFARETVRHSPLPIVLDADGLNAFHDTADELAQHESTIVMTPHHGEMARLLGIDSAVVGADPLGTARNAAERFNAIVVLKGAPTIVAVPDGRAWINSTGNPGMATAGSGDVLTGTIAGMIAGRTVNDILPGVLSAVFLHSAAGDIAAASGSVHTLSASDIIESLPAAFSEIEEE